MDQEHGSTAALGRVGSRRRLVQVGCLVVGGRTLAACLPQPETDAGAASAPTDSQGGDSSPGTAPLARLSDIPVGGGLVVRDRNIVISRGSAAGIVAFTAVCSHQGCQVTSVVGGLIRCPCHRSRFDAGTGHPVAGPATQPLTPVAIKLVGDMVVTA
ncbi:Rieske (2Fe-2S) protein [Micromonospora aurantiaca]|uniref:Rieske (2Fe-2S) protein n=1 Tax=Micromonospora aurantiaca (nom. illeg.) TaxID=47850 RepID=UPI000F4104E6|nr:Rieske (2Fe-2S) protein [Micromonospora aurantiaca]RNH98180.1 Rieske (2Fe-2S) protein [Micromonospora aurantiaca]